MIIPRAIAALTAALLLFAGAGRAAEMSAAEIVAQVFAACGGKEALGRVRAYRMEGSVTSSLRGAGTMVRTFARPDKLKVSLDYPGHPEQRLLDGTQGWRSDGKGNLLPSEGFLLGSMLLQAARADLPWLLEEKLALAKALPPMDEGKLAGLEFPLGDGLSLTVYVETATGRIVRSSGVLNTSTLKTSFATSYSDFRSVEGVLFPFRESNSAANTTTGDTIITSVRINPPLAENEFRP